MFGCCVNIQDGFITAEKNSEGEENYSMNLQDLPLKYRN